MLKKLRVVYPGKALPVLCVYSISCFLLLLPALYNGYPLVTSDTGTYIFDSVHFQVPVDRPPTYSVFIRITSLFGLSLWPVLVFQSLILVYFLRSLSLKLLKDQYTERIFTGIVLLLAVFTGAGWHCSHIMPDIFTAILVLAIADYYLSPVSKHNKVRFFIMIGLLGLFHVSNFLIVLLFCIAVRIYALIKGKTERYQKTKLVLAASCSSLVCLCFFNLWAGNSFRPSPGSHVFFMARMAENGILDQFLADYCPTEHYSICNYQGHTGDRQWDFMWQGGTHFQQAGGWAQTEKEYNTIIRRSLYRPKYLGLQIYEALEAGVRQLPLMQIAVLPYPEDSSPYNNIASCFPRELKEYRTAGQQNGEVMKILGFFNGTIFLFTITLALAALGLYKKGANPDWNFLFAVIVCFLCMNALVTAALSTVISRLQSRVFWLLPFCCILLLINIIKPSQIANHKSSGLPPA